jgi:hypothetical protein
MHLETISCPVCCGTQSHFWASENGFTAVKCDGCGLVYVNPRPAPEEISEANVTGVHRTSNGELIVTTRRKAGKIAYYRKIIRSMFERELAERKSVRWLDVGAGYGELLEAVSNLFPNGSTFSGIEPMLHKVEVAQSYGLPVVAEPLEAMKGPYDAISLINVFSHIPDFIAFGHDIRAKVARSGVLFLETGNGGDLVRRADYPAPLYLPDHLVFAGVRQMTKILKDLGFEVEKIQERRIDDIAWTIKAFLTAAQKGTLRLAMPYSSPFRTVFYKARRLS